MKPHVLFFVVFLATGKAFRFFPGMIISQNVVCPEADVVQLPQQARDAECEAMARLGSCSFYSCFEQRFPCHSCGYAENNACDRFFNPDHYHLFNSQGKRWINATSRCLTETLLTLYTQDSVTCKQTLNLMKDISTSCFTNNNVISVCDIYHDNREIFLTVLQRRGFFHALRVTRLIRRKFGSNCTRTSARASNAGFPVHR